MSLFLFDKMFSLATGLYAAAFVASVYATTSSVVVKNSAVLFVSALPALLATELTEDAKTLVSSWWKEFVGTAVMVMATCSPGAAVGSLFGYKAEWIMHWIMMAVADFSCGGPQANPAVTLSLLVCGGFGLTPMLSVTNVFAQVGGALVGWILLLAGGEMMHGQVGGPSPETKLPWKYLFLCEAFGCWTLLAAVYCFAASKPFRKAGEVAKVYSAKMSLIAGTVRMLVLVHSATGPAVNPALATGYVIASDGALPSVYSVHYTTYWLGGVFGAVAMGLVWSAINKTEPAESSQNPHKLFPSEVFKIVLGIYLAAFATILWSSYFRPYTDDIITQILDNEWELKMQKRNVVQKILRRMPEHSKAPHS